MSTPSPPQGLFREGSPGETRGKSSGKAHREQPRIRRRNRLITSCLECRRRKLKCDKQNPCLNCTRFNRSCLFIAPALDPAGQAKLAEVKEKMGMLERTLEQDVARRSSSKEPSASGLFEPAPYPGEHDDSTSSQEEEDDVKDLESHPMATIDAAYYEDEGNDDLVDLGIQMGKLRISERIGGFVRPRFHEELTQALKEVPKTDPDLNPFAKQTPEMWMAPSRDYVAPSSSFLFAPGVHRTTLLTYLPSRALSDKLIQHYWKAVHVICRTLHRPSFERRYERFWNEVNSGHEPVNSFQAVVFAALLASVVSMSEEKVLNEFAVAKDSLVENFKLATEAALSRANVLRTTRLETLQAFVMYMIPLCRAEVSRAHSALCGMVIRLAECMSLHRDPSHYSTDPVEIHVRRLIWYQICLLDLRTCEATGPRPQIRREEYDTRFPVNIDDADIEAGNRTDEDRKHFTEMTISRMRFECGVMQRLMWTERVKIDNKSTTLTAVLSKIQKFCKAMEKTYLPFFQPKHPLHVVAMEFYGILSNRLYSMVLQKYLSNHDKLMPDRMRHLVMSCAVLLIESSINLETTPALEEWRWYVGALHQNHVALLLLSELYARPRTDPVLEARVWKCLDHVFELSPQLQGPEKVRIILEELIGRTETYSVMRRLRAPSKMEHARPRGTSVEYQNRQAEEREEAGRSQRSSRSHSNSMSNTLSSGSSPQPPRQVMFGPGPYYANYEPRQQQQSQQPQQQHLPSLSALGYMTTVPHIPQAVPMDPFGPPLSMASADINISQINAYPSTQPQQPYSDSTLAPVQLPGQSPEMPQFQFFPVSASPSPAPPAGPGSHGGSSDTGSSNFNFNQQPGGGMQGSGVGHSPMQGMDAMPEIDWNEWDRLFGTAETQGDGMDGIMIPPYTFPQFDTSDLQWPTESQALQ